MPDKIRLLATEIDEFENEARAAELARAINILIKPLPRSLSDRRKTRPLSFDEVGNWTGHEKYTWKLQTDGYSPSVAWWESVDEAWLVCMEEIRRASPRGASEWREIADKCCSPPSSEGGFMIFGRRTESETAEGVLMGTRRLTLTQEDADSWRLNYHLKANLAYVVPKARRKLMSASMTSILLMAVNDDFKRIVYLIRRSRANMHPIWPFIHGSIMTRGGEWILNAIAGEMDRICDDYPEYVEETGREYGW